jgi:hypothetical protein
MKRTRYVRRRDHYAKRGLVGIGRGVEIVTVQPHLKNTGLSHCKIKPVGNLVGIKTRHHAGGVHRGSLQKSSIESIVFMAHAMFVAKIAAATVR